MSKLTKNDFDEYEKAKDVYDSLTTKIVDRIDEIILLVRECFGVRKKYNWWFPDASEGEVGTLNLDRKYGIEFTIDPYGTNKMETWNCDYQDYIPFDFLTMTDDEIKSQIKKEIEETRLKEEEAKAKKAKAKSDKEKKKQEALNKLTVEDMKALGLTKK